MHKSWKKVNPFTYFCYTPTQLFSTRVDVSEVAIILTNYSRNIQVSKLYFINDSQRIRKYIFLILLKTTPILCLKTVELSFVEQR